MTTLFWNCAHAGLHDAPVIGLKAVTVTVLGAISNPLKVNMRCHKPWSK